MTEAFIIGFLTGALIHIITAIYYHQKLSDQKGHYLKELLHLKDELIETEEYYQKKLKEKKK